MQQLTIIGNLTKDPELRTTQSGKEVCSFTVAVNRRQTQQQRQNNQEAGADYFHVSAWEERGRVCNRFLKKGSKVCVVGTVSVRAYTSTKGDAVGSLEVKADEVEFLSPKSANVDQQTGYEKVEDDDMPY